MYFKRTKIAETNFEETKQIIFQEIHKLNEHINILYQNYVA